MKRTLVQALVVFLLSMPTFMLAIGNTWTSYTLQILEGDDSPLGYSVTKNDSNLISSVIMLGSLSAIVVVGYITENIGRKRTELLSGLCFVLAWSIITTANTVTQLLIGRFMIGVGAGLHFVNGVVYVSEITQPAIRGTLLAIMSFMYNVGSLVSYTEGWFCSYDVINYINLTVAVSFVLALSFMKETPVYLLRTGTEKEAINSLKFYRGKSTVTQDILDEIVYIQKQLSNNVNCHETDFKTPESEKLNRENNIVNDTNDTNVEGNGIWSILRKSKSTQRTLIMLVVNMNLSVCMGIIAIQAYAGQFFSQAAPSLSPHLCSVILAIVITITCGMSVLIIDLIPRRDLMISTCILSAGCMACLASMLRWSWSPEWGVPIVMVLYCLFYHIGAVNIVFVQISECMPPQVNSFGTGVVMCSMFLSNFAVLFVFKPAVDALGLDGVFLSFAVIGLLTALVSFLFMRESRRVPFEIIQKSFEQGYLYRRKHYNLIN